MRSERQIKPSEVREAAGDLKGLDVEDIVLELRIAQAEIVERLLKEPPAGDLVELSKVELWELAYHIHEANEKEEG